MNKSKNASKRLETAEQTTVGVPSVGYLSWKQVGFWFAPYFQVRNDDTLSINPKHSLKTKI